MKNGAAYIVASLFLVASLFGCSPNPPNPSSSSLTVSYNNKIVHKRTEGWIKIGDLKAYLLKRQKKFIIFGARWCGPCKFVRRLVDQMNFKYEIAWIDIDEDWGQMLYRQLGRNSVPIMVEADELDRPIGVYDDGRAIVLRLMDVK